jgi:hypothetical protein
MHNVVLKLHVTETMQKGAQTARIDIDDYRVVPLLLA